MRVKIIEREVLNPLADTDSKKIKINPIPKNIDALILFDNTKPNANIILDFISKEIDFERLNKFNKPPGAPASEEQIENVQADLAILASGDCGSCTTWLVLDAIKLEKQGTPTISICSNIFAPFARELAKSYGAAELKIVEVKHPLAGQSEGIIRSRADQAIDQIKKMIS